VALAASARIEASALDRLRVMRRLSESYGNVILRLAGESGRIPRG
jgi:hypothetical protein